MRSMARIHIAALAALLVAVPPTHACDEAEVSAKRTEVEDLLRRLTRKNPLKAFDFAVELDRRKDELAAREGDDRCRVYDELLEQLRALQ